MIKNKDDFTINFYEIAPLAFQEIRKLEGIKESDMVL